MMVEPENIDQKKSKRKDEFFGETNRDIIFLISGILFVIGSILAFVLAFHVSYCIDPTMHILIGIISFLCGFLLLRKPKISVT